MVQRSEQVRLVPQAALQKSGAGKQTTPETPALTQKELDIMFARFAKKARRAFTLVEIMIVVLIIGILLAIAIPNFIRARETSRAKSCQSNLQHIDSAKEQWAMDNKKTSTDAPASSDLAPTYVKSYPTCPSNGTYTIGNVGVTPTCSVGTQSGYNDHKLQ